MSMCIHRGLWRGGAALLAAGLMLGAVGRVDAATTRYVDFSLGVDNDTCSLAQLCKTVGKAVEVAVDGDTIQISSGVYEEQLTLSKRLTLRGAGAGKTILDGNGEGRVVDVQVVTGGDNLAALEDLTIRNGLIAGTGAGVRLGAGSLILRRVSVTSNTANGNFAGGGVFCEEGTLTVFDSTFQANEAYNGGGLAVDAGCALSMDGSTTYLNNAGSGAGLAVLASGVANLTNSTLSANMATDNYLPATARGGGIEVEVDGFVNLNHVTLADNWAVDTLNDGWQLLVKGTVTLRNTIVYGTQGPDCKVSGGTIVSGGYNLSGDATCGLSKPGDLPNRDPLLGALSDNGGFTFTHALAADSPAIDAGGPPDPSTPTHDQRGLAHRDGDLDGVVRGDIGSYEHQTRGIWLPLVVR